MGLLDNSNGLIAQWLGGSGLLGGNNPGLSTPMTSAYNPFAPPPSLFGDTGWLGLIGRGLRGTAAGLANGVGYTGAAALGQGLEGAVQDARQRQLFQMGNALGGQDFQQGSLAYKRALLDYALQQKTAQFYGVRTGDSGGVPGATSPDPNAAPQLGGVNPMGPPADGSPVPGPGGQPILGAGGMPNDGGTPASNWRAMLNSLGQRMLGTPGLSQDGAKLIETAQKAPEGFQFTPDFQQMLRIGGGPQDIGTIGQNAAAAAAGALPYKQAEAGYAKSLDVANAGQMGFNTTQGTNLALEQTAKARNEVVNALAADYSKDPTVLEWQKANLALGTAKQALATPDQHASDILLTQAAIQMAVPNATLRPGNIDDINAVVGIPQALANIRQKLTGRGGMTTADRQTLQSFIQNKWQDINATHQQTQQSFIKRAGGSGQTLNPQEFMPDYQSNQPMTTKNFNTLPTDAIKVAPGADGKPRWYSPSLHGYLSEQ
jgi:hypothetical protein